MTLIVHHHIFKNAGTTLDWILQRNFPGQVLHMEGTDPGARLRSGSVRAAAARFPDHRAISSHSLPLPSPRDAWAQVHISVLRDPIERYASIYRFERRREIDHPANRAARERGFDAFCRWWLDSPSGIWTNWQTRCCTPQGSLGWTTWPLRKLARPLRRILSGMGPGEREGSGLPGWEANLPLALEAALNTGFVFTLDRFDQGLVLLEERLRALGTELDTAYIRQNATRDGSDPDKDLDEALDPELHQRLIAANSLDFELLRQVRGAIDARYSALDPTGDRLAVFRQRCRQLCEAPGRPPSVTIPGPSDWIVLPN